MNTKASKPARIRPIVALLDLALPLALILSLAGLAFASPAGASAQTPEANGIDTQYEGCEPQIYVSSPKAAKPQGDKQPLDLFVTLTDGWGNPIVGAKVLARATDFYRYVDATLADMGNGVYGACAFGYFDGYGPGALSIHIRAQKEGYTPGSNDGTNSVGRLCPVTGPMSSR